MIVGGADASRFLNDLISQEIGDLSDGESRRSFLLAPDGKLRFVLKVFKDNSGFGLLTEPTRGEDLAQALSRYRIRVDVEISVSTEPAFVVVGPGKGVDISWPDVPRWFTVGEAPDLPEMDGITYESIRVRSGVPRWGVDIDENTIPHESGLVPNSVDFTKGCFLGQELVARIDSRGGNVPRRLRHVAVQDGHARLGAEVVLDGESVGVLSSVSESLGLGLIHRNAPPGQLVTVDGIEAIVKNLPWETDS